MISLSKLPTEITIVCVRDIWYYWDGVRLNRGTDFKTNVQNSVLEISKFLGCDCVKDQYFSLLWWSSDNEQGGYI